MSRRNRNNNRYNSRNRNKWDEGYEDDYFDEDDSSDQQDEYDQSEYEDEEEEYDEDESEDEEEYDEDEYDEDEYDEDEYDEDSDEEYDEDESEDEEYDEEEYDEEDESDEEEDSDEEYDEDDSDEEVDEEEEDESDEDEDEDDELESEINAATESTAKKNLGNSDLLSKLRGQMRPQIKEDAQDSNSGKDKDLEINVSPLSLFGQPIVKNGKKDDAPASSSVQPQHANAKIVQTTVSAKTSTPSMAGSMHKAASGRVITAQSLNGASVSSVQPRDLEAEKAEAERKQKEKELLEQEQKEKEEKSNRILDKFKGKKTPAGETAVNATKAGGAWLWSGVVWTWSKITSGCAWTWSKIVSGGAWIWAGIAACFLWLFWSKPGQAWQTWRIFNSSWWSGIGSGVWNAMKYPFVRKSAVVTDEAASADGATANSADASVSPDSEPAIAVADRKKSRKKSVKTVEPALSPAADAPIVSHVSTEPESRRRLLWSLSSIGTAAVVSLLLLPLLTNGNRKTDENAIALNEQENSYQTSETNESDSDSNDSASRRSSGGRVLPVKNQTTFDNADASGGRVLPAKKQTTFDNADNVRSPETAPQLASRNSHAPSARNNPGTFDNTRNPRTFDNTRAPGAYDNTQPLTPPAYSNNAVSTPRSSQLATRNSQLSHPGHASGGRVLPAKKQTTFDYADNVRSPGSAPSVPELDMTAPEMPAPEVTLLDAPELDTTDQELSTPEIPSMDSPELELTVPETSLDDAPVPEVPTEIPVPELPTDDASVQENSPIEIPVPELPTDDAVVPQYVPTENPVSEDVQSDVSEIPEPELVNAEDPADALSTPDQAADTNNAADPFNLSSPDVPEDSTVDLTANADNLSSPDVEPETDEQPDAPVELPEPETDVPEVPMPELPNTEPVDSTPIEEPSTPEPTVPEPTVPEPAVEEPAPIDSGIASQPIEPAASEPVLTPETNATNNSLASDSPEPPTIPESTGVELGTPGPLVSSNASSIAQTQPQIAAAANPNVNISEPSTTPDYGTSYNNGYVYNSSGVYIVQPNDSFWTIAKRVYGSGEYARALAQYNSSRVRPESLTASTQIMTPPPETLEQQYPELCPTRRWATSASQQTAAAAQPNTRVYVVDQEESVMEIVRRELGSVLYCSQVYALNQDQLSGSVDRVKPGVRLLLPVKK